MNAVECEKRVRPLFHIRGCTYLPVLAFFVPDDYELQGSSYEATLSEELTALFGTDEVISVYSEQTGITYILPASLKGLFVRAAGVSPASLETPSGIGAGTAETTQPTLTDIYCAQTAREALTDEDLTWLIDLIVNKLEPQAVNLLLDKFPAFRTAADKGEIGTQIGLYIFFAKGDKDGDPAHDIEAEGALAYVDDASARIDGALRYSYMIGVNAAALVKRDDEGTALVDPATGRYILARSGEGFETFVNTIVHEMFHAFMNDYNRLGMFGTAGLANRQTDASGDWKNPRTAAECAATRFPAWFIEGSASAMENVYQYRNGEFHLLSRDLTGSTPVDNVLDNYLNARYLGTPVYFDLKYCDGVDADGNEVDNSCANYVSGYLAVLYLSDLANMHVSGGGSAVGPTKNGRLAISNDKLRTGLNQNRTDAETAKEANLSAEPQEDYQNRTCAETEEAANAADQNAEPQENTPEEVSELTEADKATGTEDAVLNGEVFEVDEEKPASFGSDDHDKTTRTEDVVFLERKRPPDGGRKLGGA